MRVVEMTGPDTRMDERANPLPVKCPHCTMPDLDFVARPYLLTRGFAAPAETAPAEVGNFLVRDRVRKILQIAAPGSCTFVSTAEKKSKKPIRDWWLAVPVRVVDMPGLPLASKKDGRCKKCGEPSTGYYPYRPVKGKPNEYRHLGLDHCDCRGLDVFKSRQWLAVDTIENQYAQALKYTERGEEPPAWSNFGARLGVKDPPSHPQRWTRVNISRELFFSVRLEQLLKRAKVKGQLVRAANERVPQLADVQPSADDLEWTEDKLRLLARAGLVDARPAAATAKTSSGADKWFEEYVKKNAVKKPPAKTDFPALEKKLKLTLPKEYKQFISIIGPKVFRNVMEIGGFTARVLAPKGLDARSYRRDKWKKLRVESDVDGIAFAETDHGDVFVLEASKKDGGAVFWYDHEQNSVEPFAASFAECIKRFEERS